HARRQDAAMKVEDADVGARVIEVGGGERAPADEAGAAAIDGSQIKDAQQARAGAAAGDIAAVVVLDVRAGGGIGDDLAAVPEGHDAGEEIGNLEIANGGINQAAGDIEDA